MFLLHFSQKKSSPIGLKIFVVVNRYEMQYLCGLLENYIFEFHGLR